MRSDTPFPSFPGNDGCEPVVNADPPFFSRRTVFGSHGPTVSAIFPWTSGEGSGLDWKETGIVPPWGWQVEGKEREGSFHPHVPPSHPSRGGHCPSGYVLVRVRLGAFHFPRGVGTQGREMSAINVTQVSVLGNPAPYTHPFQFEISYECLYALQDGEKTEPEWRT